MCAICGQKEIFLTADDLKRARPRCANCSNPKKPRNDRPQISEIAESVSANGLTVTDFEQAAPPMQAPKPSLLELERLEDQQKGLTREELQLRERRRKQIQTLMKFFPEEDAIAQWQKLEEIKQLKRMQEGHLKRLGREMTAREYDALLVLSSMAGMKDSPGCPLAFHTYDETMACLDAFCERRRGDRPSATLRVFSLHRQVARIATLDAADVYMAVGAVMERSNLDHCAFTLGDPVGDPELGFFIVATPGSGDVMEFADKDCPKDLKPCDVIDK